MSLAEESMPSRRTFFFLTLTLVLALAATATLAQTGDPGEKVLIRTAKPYDALVADIQSLGGRVTYEYKYVDAIAAEVPRNVLASLRDWIGVGNVTKGLRWEGGSPLASHLHSLWCGAPCNVPKLDRAGIT